MASRYFTRALLIVAFLIGVTIRTALSISPDATTGFSPAINCGAGPPTGTPSLNNPSSRWPYYDQTNSKLYVYNSGAWQLVGPSAGSGGITDTTHGGTGLNASGVTDGQLLIGQTSDHSFGLSTLLGTSNQVNVVNGPHSVQLSGPQDLAPTSDVRFASVATSRTVITKTSNYLVPASETNSVYVTTGAGGAVDFTLPTWAAGLTYTFSSDAPQIMRVWAGGSDVIRYGDRITISGGNLATTSSGRGNTIWIVATVSGVWVVQGGTGTTWSVN